MHHIAFILGASLTLFACAAGFGLDTPDTTAEAGNRSWPVSADGDLPHSGIFYGASPVGILTANSTIASQHSRRWRAQRSGAIVAVRYANRTLGSENIEARCEQYGRGPDSAQPQWCVCKDNDISATRCGYYLNNSYSVGNGGRQRLEIRRDDGQGSPDMSAAGRLGITRTPFVPVDNADVLYPTLPLREPVAVVAGHLYHTVYVNLAPPSRCAMGRVRPVLDTRHCPEDEGAISLNGVLIPSVFGEAGKLGPWLGTSAANLFRNDLEGAWSLDEDNLSFHEVRYRDGTWTGFALSSYNAIFSAADQGDGSNVRKVIGGAVQARQRFTVQDATRTVTGVWVMFGHHDGRADGSALSVELHDAAGRSLATGTLAANADCNQLSADDSDYRRGECRAWGYAGFDKDARLVRGQDYTLTLHGGEQAHFALSAHFPLNYGPYQSTNVDFWSDAEALISTDGGRSFGGWIGDYHDDRDLPVLFSIKGMPTTLP